MPQKVFIVHGRDVVTRDQLAKFVTAIGLEDLPFSAIASALGPTPFIADIILEAFRKADVVLVLFTPDESATLFDSKTAEWLGQDPSGTRWQARPNVLFEAGVGFGLHREKTILLSLGADTRLFSDVDGVHIVRLDSSGAKEQLLKRIQGVLPNVAPSDADWESPGVSGDFKKCVRKRWSAYDEIHVLADQLRARTVGDGNESESLFEIARRVATEDERNWANLNPRDFMESIATSSPKNFTNSAYWWLTVYGFFRFTGIDQFFEDDGQNWKYSVDYTEITPRALALIERYRCGLR